MPFAGKAFVEMGVTGQAELIQQMNNCAAKVNDSAWRIIKRKSAGDISAPIGLAMIVSKLGYEVKREDLKAGSPINSPMLKYPIDELISSSTFNLVDSM